MKYFSPQITALKNEWCLDDFKFGSITFHAQRNQPAKYENLAIAPLKPFRQYVKGKHSAGIVRKGYLSRPFQNSLTPPPLPNI